MAITFAFANPPGGFQDRIKGLLDSLDVTYSYKQSQVDGIHTLQVYDDKIAAYIRSTLEVMSFPSNFHWIQAASDDENHVIRSFVDDLLGPPEFQSGGGGRSDVDRASRVPPVQSSREQAAPSSSSVNPFGLLLPISSRSNVKVVPPKKCLSVSEDYEPDGKCHLFSNSWMRAKASPPPSPPHPRTEFSTEPRCAACDLNDFIPKVHTSDDGPRCWHCNTDKHGIFICPELVVAEEIVKPPKIHKVGRLVARQQLTFVHVRMGGFVRFLVDLVATDVGKQEVTAAANNLRRDHLCDNCTAGGHFKTDVVYGDVPCCAYSLAKIKGTPMAQIQYRKTFMNHLRSRLSMKSLDPTHFRMLAEKYAHFFEAELMANRHVAQLGPYEEILPEVPLGSEWLRRHRSLFNAGRFSALFRRCQSQGYGAVQD